MRNAGLEEVQAGIKIAGRSISNLRYADDTTLMEESKDEIKSLLMKVKAQSEKNGLKVSIHKPNIMASSPVTSLQMDRKILESVTNILFFRAPKSLRVVTAAMELKHACSMEEKLWLT